MFEKASRLKLRFDTPKGPLAAEDLWDLPLTSTTGKANLDDLARDLHRSLKDSDDSVSFVAPTPSAKNEAEALRFEIVKHVISVKIAENDAAKKSRERGEQKQRIMALIAEKEDKALADKPIDELKALVSAL